MADVVITEFMDPVAVAVLADRYDTVYDPELWDGPERLAVEAATARALVVRNKTSVTAELIAGAPHLMVVGRLGVGLDNIDVDACAAAGVAVRPATGANNVAVAEYVIGAALLLTRRAFGVTEAVIAGSWPREQTLGNELSGKVLGLVGLGAIAREVAARAAALGMAVIAHDPLLDIDAPAWDAAERCEEMANLLSRADVVSLHVPLNDDTAGLVGATAISAMKAGAVLINTSRGGVVDEAAVAAALRSGALGGAAFDVFATEPVDADYGATFSGIPNLILTPHIAGITEESNAAVSQMVAEHVTTALGDDGPHRHGSR
jgi:(S)-sulfolactate dehydrogenase